MLIGDMPIGDIQTGIELPAIPLASRLLGCYTNSGCESNVLWKYEGG